MSNIEELRTKAGDIVSASQNLAAMLSSFSGDGSSPREEEIKLLSSIAVGLCRIRAITFQASELAINARTELERESSIAAKATSK